MLWSLFTFDIGFGASIGSRFTCAIWIGMIGFVFIMTVSFFRISNCFFCLGMPVLLKQNEWMNEQICCAMNEIKFDDCLNSVWKLTIDCKITAWILKNQRWFLKNLVMIDLDWSKWQKESIRYYNKSKPKVVFFWGFFNTKIS